MSFFKFSSGTSFFPTFPSSNDIQAACFSLFGRRPEPVSSAGVVDPVEERLGPPERVGVVELEEVHARAGVRVGASVHFLKEMTKKTVNNERQETP